MWTDRLLDAAYNCQASWHINITIWILQRLHTWPIQFRVKTICFIALCPNSPTYNAAKLYVVFLGWESTLKICQPLSFMHQVLLMLLNNDAFNNVQIMQAKHPSFEILQSASLLNVCSQCVSDETWITANK